MNVEQLKKQLRLVLFSYLGSNLLLILFYIIFMGGIPSRHDPAAHKLVFVALQLALVIVHFRWYRIIMKRAK